VLGALSDPVLELHMPDGSVISNDNWKATQATAIQRSGIAPQSDLESAILVELEVGQYTAVVRGKNGATRIALIEVYEMNPNSSARLLNISTRALVGKDDGVIIGGFIMGNGAASNVLIRALGPTLKNSVASKVLADPMLEIRDQSGTLVAANDNWTTERTAVRSTGLAPSKETEAAFVSRLLPGSYTAIVRGKNNSTGVALVEIYSVN
jgi:hypothetical protein